MHRVIGICTRNRDISGAERLTVLKARRHNSIIAFEIIFRENVTLMKTCS